MITVPLLMQPHTYPCWSGSFVCSSIIHRLSIFYYCPSCTQGRGRCWSLSQPSPGKGRVIPRTSRHVERQTTICTHAYGQFGIDNMPLMHVFGQWVLKYYAVFRGTSLEESLLDRLVKRDLSPCISP